jgi:membrane associated rhomboid family serine protease
VLTWALIAANVAAFVLELTLGGRLDAFVRRWGLVPADVLESVRGVDGPAALVTLLTSAFLTLEVLPVLYTIFPASA